MRPTVFGFSMMPRNRPASCAHSAPATNAAMPITRKKGLVDLLRAVSLLPGAHLLITGPDGNDGTLRALRRHSSTLNGRLHIDVRGVWDREKLDAFADADCFALPSQTENFGNARPRRRRLASRW
jgi:glycosyltransferase involved in cell wall biosynthesis